MHEQRLIEQQVEARLDITTAMGANEQWLWHGTSHTNPLVLCSGLDGVDFRRVRTLHSVPCSSGWHTDTVHQFRHTHHRSCAVTMLCLLCPGMVAYFLCGCGCAVVCGWLQSNPGYYGRGAYFAESAAYSNGSYAFQKQRTTTTSTRQLLLVRVLCGVTRDYGQIRRPELKKPPPRCHSVCGGPHLAGRCAAPTKMWVVYDRAQVYPAYIVTYDVPQPHA